MHSNGTTILTTFKTTSVIFKVTENIVEQTKCKMIGYHKTTNNIFNNSLYMSIYGSTKYSKYNKYILEAGTTTATINNQKNKVWLHFSHE